MKPPVHWGLAGYLVRVCAQVNDRIGISISAKGTELRLIPASHPDVLALKSQYKDLPEFDMIVVFAGSNSFRDWFSNFNFIKRAWPPFGRVHGGFLSGFRAIIPELTAELAGSKRVLWAGHSRGGPEAVLGALWWWNDMDGEAPGVITYGAPRMGDSAFKEAVKNTGILIQRIIVGADCVCRHPASLDDCHPGAAYYLTARGKDSECQDMPVWWRILKRLHLSADNHIVADEYTRAVCRRAKVYTETGS